MAKDIFKRLSAGRPPSPGESAPLATPLPVRKLFDWLQHDWNQPTVCARDIYRHGPRPVREDRKTALEAAEILVRRGWLVPMKTHAQTWVNRHVLFTHGNGAVMSPVTRKSAEGPPRGSPPAATRPIMAN